MLKQLFNSKQILKVINTNDFWRWDILNTYGDIQKAADIISANWKKESPRIKELSINKIANKSIYTPQNLEDHLAIKITDRYLRRIYKVRQSDRNRMIRQTIALMRDQSNIAFIRLDIKDCYESIIYSSLIDKIKSDLILSPKCITVLEDIHKLLELQGNNGLPRGISVSSTLAELYLEKLDKMISSESGIIFSARYVDDVVIAVQENDAEKIKNKIEEKIINFLKLQVNHEKSCVFLQNSGEFFELLGYSFSTNRVGGVKKVYIGVSERKLNKIKARIALSLIDYKRNNNFKLLLDRIYYLSSLRIVRKNSNGNLLAGNAYNYFYATDFRDFKKIDGFFLGLINSPRFNLLQSQKSSLEKISFYRMAKKKKIMNITKNRTRLLKKAWLNE